MKSKAERPYRIFYTTPEGQERVFYIKGENPLSALTDFKLRTGHSEECVTLVEVEVKALGVWQKAM